MRATHSHPHWGGEEYLRHLAAIVDSSDGAIFSSTLDGIILSWNAAAERIYGYSAEEAIGRSIAILVPPDCPDDPRGRLERLARGERIEPYETTQARKDGARITVVLTLSPLRDAEGRITGASTIAHEIIERNRSDAARRQRLEESAGLAQRYRSLFEGVPVGLYRSTPTGAFLEVNPALLRLLHYPDVQTLTTHNAAALYSDPDVWVRWMAVLVSEGKITDFECQLRRYDGTLIWVQTSAHLVRDADGNAEYLDGAIIDITERKDTEAGLQARTAKLEAVYHVGRQLREARSVEEMYGLLVDHAMHLLGAEHGTLALFTEDRRSLRRVYASGFLSEPGSVFPVAGSLSETVVQTDQPFVAADLASGAPRTWQEGARFRELGPILIVPVRSEREISGTLALARKRVAGVQPFTDADVHFLTALVEIGGTAIRRARLYDGLQQAYFQTVLALAGTVDARDSYTGSHSDELARWVETLARRMGCGDDEVRDVRWAALLHDIGKIAVPDEILRKEGPLTDEEWAVMLAHPVIGEEILLFVDGMQRVATIVRHHQERWDGTGYPDGLEGEDIPLAVRILTVADSFGAIVNDRPYRKGRPSDEAITEIRQHSGTQFDPAVVEAFCQMVAEHVVNPDTAPRQASDASDDGRQAPAALITRSLSNARRVARIVPAMADVARHLLRPLDLPAVLDEILSLIHEVFGYPICAIFFVDQPMRELRLQAQHGYDPELTKNMSLHGDTRGIAGWVADHGRPYYAADVTVDPLYVVGASAARSKIVYPLIVDDMVIGVLDVESPVVGGFPKEIRDVLEAFAVLAALAILRAQRDEDLTRLAHTDGLTGLANHRALWEALEREVAATSRAGAPLSLIVVEIDGFKDINDRFGHLQGDIILRAVADTLRQNSRTTDLASRVGGDEFLLLLPGLAKDMAASVAERIRHHVEQTPVPEGIKLTVSVGLACLPADGHTARALAEAADQAMYAVKRNGGNRIHVA